MFEFVFRSEVFVSILRCEAFDVERGASAIEPGRLGEAENCK